MFGKNTLKNPFSGKKPGPAVWAVGAVLLVLVLLLVYLLFFRQPAPGTVSVSSAGTLTELTAVKATRFHGGTVSSYDFSAEEIAAAAPEIAASEDLTLKITGKTSGQTRITLYDETLEVIAEGTEPEIPDGQNACLVRAEVFWGSDSDYTSCYYYFWLRR